MEKIPIRSIKPAQKEPDLLGSLSIRNIQELLSEQDLIQELHRHDFFLILALKKGTGNHEIDFTPYEVCDNSIFFMRPGQVHKLFLKAGSSGYLMQFKPDFFYNDTREANQLLRKAGNQIHCRLDDLSFRKLQLMLENIFEEVNSKKENYQEVIKSYLNIFFIEHIRNHQNMDHLSKNSTTYEQERLEEFLALLETNITVNKQVSYYADMLNLSTFQLNSITKATLGKNSSELIDQNIILEARRYLLATSKQVNQIAYQLGYDDASYFIRFFKKHTGYSPEAFRNNFR